MRRFFALLLAASFLAPTLGRAAALAPGDLIKGSGPAVYYYGADGKRYVFPTEATYRTWYTDFSSVKTISDAELGAIMIGGNATYRPGVRLVKVTTDPKVYAIARGGVLRWVQSEGVATSLYGADWRTLIDDLPDPFFINYRTGALIGSMADFTPSAETTGTTTIDADKNLSMTPAPLPTPTPTPTPVPTPTATSTRPTHVGYLWVSNETPRFLERVEIRAWDPGNSIQQIKIFFDNLLVTSCTTFMCIHIVTIPTNNVKDNYPVRAEYQWSDGTTQTESKTLLREQGFAGRDWYNTTPDVKPNTQHMFGVTVTTPELPFRIDLYLDGVMVNNCFAATSCDYAAFETSPVGTVHTAFARIYETNQSTPYDTPTDTITVTNNPRPVPTIAIGKTFVNRGETLDVSLRATDDNIVTATEIYLDGTLLKRCQTSICSIDAGPWNAIRSLVFVGRAVDDGGRDAYATSSSAFVQ
jgi:hypothetical protein